MNFKAPTEFMSYFCLIGECTFLGCGKDANIHQSYTCKFTQHMVCYHGCNGYLSALILVLTIFVFCFQDSSPVFRILLVLLFSNSSASFITCPNYQNVRGDFQNLGLRPLRRESLVFIVTVEIYAND